MPSPGYVMPQTLSGPMPRGLPGQASNTASCRSIRNKRLRRCNYRCSFLIRRLDYDKSDPADVLQLRTSVETLNPSHPCSLGSAKQNHQSPNPPHADN